jgi:hypothetical protein
MTRLMRALRRLGKLRLPELFDIDPLTLRITRIDKG